MRDFYLPHIISRTRAQVAYTVDPKKIVKVHGNFFLVFIYFVLCAVGRYFFSAISHIFWWSLALGLRMLFLFFYGKEFTACLTYASYFFFVFQSWIVTIHNTYDVAKFWFRYEIQYNMQKISIAKFINLLREQIGDMRYL